MKRLLILIGLLVGQYAMAQPASFDIATYTVPKGWTPEMKDFAASYIKTNNVTKSWCRFTIYKSIQSSSTPLADFTNEWTALIVKNNWGPATPPQTETETEEGWTSHSGVSTFTYENKEAYSLLTTISGYGVEVSIVVLMNSNEYMKEIEQLLLSLELKKPEQPLQQTQPNQPVTQSTSQNGFTVTNTPGNTGILTATTNFDDGWVAQPFADYVKVSKGNITVLLHYGIEITDELRNTNDIQGTLFDRLMQPRYTVSNIRKYDNGGPCYFCVYFYEADVVEKSSGKKYYAGFRVLTESGVSRCLEILSPSKQEFDKEFPTQEKIAALTGYNKFAITQADLIGTWEESGGSYVNMYSTVTGAYAGMNSASSAHKFIFKSDGTYFSNHKGAYGMVGSMTFFDQKYNGSYTVTNWDLTATKRFEGKTDIFWAEFEAIRGGRVLHLTDKSASGMKYHLGKTE